MEDISYEPIPPRVISRLPVCGGEIAIVFHPAPEDECVPSRTRARIDESADSHP